MTDREGDPPFDPDPFVSSRADIARRLRTFIDHWRDETLRGAPFAQSADLWIYLQGAVADLKARIADWI